MKLTSRSITADQPIDPKFAFGKKDLSAHIALSDNINPHLQWEEAPKGTQSFVVLCVDHDVPTVGDDVNREDKEVPADLPRTDFYHWVLYDIPATTCEIAEGSHSKGVTAKGKGGPVAPDNAHHGLNDYTQWFANDHDMKGEYFGYDGPCPPFNDALVHRYVFTVYALDIPKISVSNSVLDGRSLMQAIQGHILDQASISATYSLNPKLS